MPKRILLVLGAVLVVAGGVAALSAWEAHVINVTAKIENALYVHPDKIEFGTVFPQEYVERDFTVELSGSFLAQTRDRYDNPRVADVDYIIVQKPKPIWLEPETCGQEFEDIEEAREYCLYNSTDYDCCYLSLCPFLSKLDGDPLDYNDTGVPSYYIPGHWTEDTVPVWVPPTCQEPSPGYATGYLHIDDDPLDIWKVDLKVPPVEGYVGQDWPTNCPVVEEDGATYGCDLWVEVKSIPAVD